MMSNDFNPYDLLHAIAEQCDTLHRNNIELAKAHNKQAKALEELSRQHRELVDATTQTRQELIHCKHLLRKHEILYHNETE